MNVYASDPRVTTLNIDHYDVFAVPGGPLTGCVRRRSGDVFAAITKADEARPPTFDTADNAVWSLIGDPQ